MKQHHLDYIDVYGIYHHLKETHRFASARTHQYSLLFWLVQLYYYVLFEFYLN